MNTSRPEQIELPPPSVKGTVSLEEVLARRRSVRRFAATPLTRCELAQLLWSANGATGSQYSRRTIPSAGAAYPLEIFIVCGENSVEEIGAGVYRYDSGKHSLTMHVQGDLRPELVLAGLDQDFIFHAPVDIVICAVQPRTTAYYGSRGERYVHIEVGHAGQNIYLQATALGLGTVAVGAFRDEQVKEVLCLGKGYDPLYIMPVGRPA